MRAKTINEINFERGGEPMTNMGIGKAADVKKLLDSVYNEKQNRHYYFVYNIKSLDRIEIRYSDWLRDDIRSSKTPESADTLWIIKYVEKNHFIIEEDSYELGNSTHSFGTQYNWNILEVKFYIEQDPKRMQFTNKFILALTQKDKLNEERAKVIIDAFNDHYGPKTIGFELIEKTTDAS
jgi:hypothetical protein